MAKFYFKKAPNAGGYIITAFQTVGYTSILASRYLEEKGAIKDIGYIDLDIETPVAVIDRGEISFPVRILQAENSIFINSQFPLGPDAVDALITQILEIYKKYKFKGIICLDGLAIDQGKDVSDLYYVCTKDGFQPANAKKLEDGAIIGLNAELTLKAKSENIPVTLLMAETHSEIPDGLAAATLITALSPIGIHVDTKELVSEYKQTLAKIDDMLKKLNKKEEPNKNDVYG